MRKFSLFIVVLATLACADAVAPPGQGMAPQLARAGSGREIVGQYIVVFKSYVSDAEARARVKNRRVRGELRHTYRGAIKGFAAGLSDAAVSVLAVDPDVAYIERDRVASATALTTQSAPNWGLDRIDERALPYDGTYAYYTSPSAQSKVKAYIIDTGIQTTHPDFGGRASVAWDAIGGNGQDCNGHGTHVAGIVGSNTYGVAKGVTLRAVRVLPCSGTGAISNIIAGMDWVRLNHVKPAVANLSVGSGYSVAFNAAANNLAAAGVFVVTSAGNSNSDACTHSPSSAANVVSVAASTSTDARAGYSNYGSCVHLYAPGTSIRSTWIGSGYYTNSGTSMAAPHVTGVGALYKSVNGDASYATIRAAIVNKATVGVITGNPAGTPNRLLFKATL